MGRKLAKAGCDALSSGGHLIPPDLCMAAACIVAAIAVAVVLLIVEMFDES